MGGTHDIGVLFSWDPNTNVSSRRMDFDGREHGSYSYGSLFHAGQGKIYGMTAGGGANDGGVLFEWDYNRNIFTKKFDFNDEDGNRPTYGTLTATGINATDSMMHVSVCDKYNFNGRILTSSGTYYDTIPNAAGCDSMITLNLTILR